ncbi:50S ribosomal protein L18e [Candidatus Woesearchaeota archaeon]|jgi:large subunit ribosomal protein L18e|nr:50S ribosomal protein L18e [Candidatus Woesearchaeota archaeon]MBT4114703.1 50S ribosomal protein L18e [Candidatus Woesearchaeota archaeon]MBT4248159.1 50S ribosomal protein L18e [Candidatus Woesearchaeota archaeon]
MRQTKSTNSILRKLLANLKKQSNQNKVKIWASLASNLSKPARIQRTVNLTHLERYGKAGETLVVPGKVLGTGVLSKKMTVAAWRFSEKAFQKINKTGTAISIDELMKKNPAGKKVRIIG